MPALNGPACESCSMPNPSGARYCMGCGQPMPPAAARRCAECGAELVSGARFCSRCGTAVTRPPGTPAS